MNIKLRTLLNDTIKHLVRDGSPPDFDVINALKAAVAEDGDPDSVIYPLDIKVIGLSEVAIFLGCPIEVLTSAADDSDYAYGTNHRTLVAREAFIEDILEQTFGDYDHGEEEQKVLDKFRAAVADTTYIDLEA